MQPIYVEVSDEITTVIERMRESQESALVLVVPKGAVLLQSIVNLKLAKKAAADAGKPITLVTTDKIGRNLAAQVGVPVVTRVDESPSDTAAAPEEGDAEPNVIAGVKIHRYYDDGKEAEAEEDPVAAPLEPIVPREIMREAAPEEPPVSPIIVREIAPAKALAPTLPTPIAIPDPEEKKSEDKEPVKDPEIPPVVPAIAAAEPTLASSKKSSKPDKPVTPSRNRRKALIFSAYLLLLALLGATGVAAFYLPKTDVSLVVPADPWSTELTTEAKSDSTTLPPEILKIEVDDSVTAKPTGTKELGEKASGTAKIYNGASTTPQSLPAGTVISAGGHNFTTQQAVTVPGYTQDSGKSPVFGSATVTIKANDPGTESNLTGASGSITSPQTSLIVQDITTTGGTSKQVAVVTATDIANAKAALAKKLREAADHKVVVDLQNRSVLFDAATDAFTTDSLNSTAAAAESRGSWG